MVVCMSLSPHTDGPLTVGKGAVQAAASFSGWWVRTMDFPSIQPNKFSVTSGTSSFADVDAHTVVWNSCQRTLSHVVFRRGSQGLMSLNSKTISYTIGFREH